MTKEKLVKALIKLFNEKGITFKVDELAEELKASKKTIYKVCRSKEQIIELIITEVFESIKKQEQEVINDSSIDIVDKIKTCICIFPDFDINFDYIKEIKIKYPTLYKQIEHRLESNWEFTFNLIQEAIDQNKLRTMDFDSLKLILISLTKEILFLDKDLQQKKFRDCVDLIFEGYIITK